MQKDVSRKKLKIYLGCQEDPEAGRDAFTHVKGAGSGSSLMMEEVSLYGTSYSKKQSLRQVWKVDEKKSEEQARKNKEGENPGQVCVTELDCGQHKPTTTSHGRSCRIVHMSEVY